MDSENPYFTDRYYTERIQTDTRFERVFLELERRVMRMVEHVTASSAADQVYERPNQKYTVQERPFYGETSQLHQVRLKVVYFSETIVPSEHSQTLHRYTELVPDAGDSVGSRWVSFRELAKSSGVTLSDPALVLDTYADDFKRADSPFQKWWDTQVDGAEYKPMDGSE